MKEKKEVKTNKTRECPKCKQNDKTVMMKHMGYDLVSIGTKYLSWDCPECGHSISAGQEATEVLRVYVKDTSPENMADVYAQITKHVIEKNPHILAPIGGLGEGKKIDDALRKDLEALKILEIELDAKFREGAFGDQLLTRYRVDKNKNRITGLEFSLGKRPLPKTLLQFDELTHLRYSYHKESPFLEIPELIKSLTKLESLTISGGLKEIKNLDTLVNLKTLDLSHNEISEIKGLENLSNLKYLKLNNNKIRKMEGLENLSNLFTLELWSNEITKIEGLNNFNDLHILDLNGNPLSSFEGLEHYNIENIGLLGNLKLGGKDIDFDSIKSYFSFLPYSLDGYKYLEEKKRYKIPSERNYLYVIYSQFKYIEDNGIDAEFVKLKGTKIYVWNKRLCLKHFNITDLTKIKGLEDLGELDYLDLSGNRISKIDVFKKPLRVKELNLRKNEITKIKGLEMFRDLEKLDLSWNAIVSINGLEHLENLKELNLFSNKLKQIPTLGNLKKLEHLQLGDNLIKKITNLESLENLQFLDFYRNEIRDISGLSYLKNLIKLSFQGNQISEIKSLQELKNLERLDLAGNEINKISGLESLTNLKELILANNKISQIEGLDNLINLKSLSIHSNNIPRREWENYIEKHIRSR